jgi:tetratricopeptide (TPR) repeat protein
MSFAPAAALLTAILGTAPLPLYAADPSGVAPADEPTAKQFAAAIDKSNAQDPQSPETLSTRLGFADFLAKAEGGDCEIRLDRAQEQLELARASPVIGIALPLGLAHAADIEYQVHFARASCSSGASAREQELRAAIACAQRGVDLYRDAFDAVSMVTMQFNAGVAYHSLGDAAAAIATLQTAIDMDREYGFEEDAADNYKLLLQWENREAGPEQVEALMQDFPQRSTTLSFGWVPGDSNVGLDIDYVQLANEKVLHYHAARAAQRQVRKGLASWVVSYQTGEPHYDFGGVPNADPSVQGFGLSLTGMLLHFHDFSVARNGDFNSGGGTFRFASRMRADADALARNLASHGDAKRLTRGISKTVTVLLYPETTEGLVAEDYNLETGTWIGSTLEQGVWYEMTVPLSLTLAPQVFLAHKIEFAFTRQVPCTADSVDPTCVEIVLRATPDPAVLGRMLDNLARLSSLPHGQMPQLWSVNHMRLVIDPATLQPYTCEMRRHAYWSTGATGPDHSLIASEKTVTVSGPHQKKERT